MNERALLIWILFVFLSEHCRFVTFQSFPFAKQNCCPLKESLYQFDLKNLSECAWKKYFYIIIAVTNFKTLKMYQKMVFQQSLFYCWSLENSFDTGIFWPFWPSIHVFSSPRCRTSWGGVWWWALWKPLSSCCWLCAPVACLPGGGCWRSSHWCSGSGLKKIKR